MDCTNEDNEMVVGDSGIKMKLSTLLISMKIEKKVTDVIGASGACKTMKEAMNEWEE